MGNRIQVAGDLQPFRPRQQVTQSLKVKYFLFQSCMGNIS